MHINKTLSLFSVAALASACFGLTTGCGSDAAEPAEAQARINTIVPAIAQSTEHAVIAMEGIPAIGWLTQSMGAIESTFGGGETEPEPPPFFTVPGHNEGAQDIGADLAQLLIDNVFNDAGYEGDGVYRLRGDVVCVTFDNQIDQVCADEIDAAEIRFHARLAGDGMDVTVLVGPARVEPLLVELRSDQVAAIVDLAQAKEAIAFLAGPGTELPRVLEGVLAMTLTVHAQDDVSIVAAVREAIRIEAALPGDAGTLSFSTEARDPLFAARMNGPDLQLALALDIGRTVLSMPFDMFSETSTGHILSADLGGLSMATTLDDDATAVTISGIGLGQDTTSVKLDDATIFAMDLNADAGRRFDLTLNPGETGIASFTMAPGFDLSLTFNLRPLVEIGEAAGDFLLDETLRIAFSGNQPTAEPLAPDFDSGFDGGLRVTAGTLAISSTAVAEPVVVEANQCLLSAEPAPDAHPLLGALAVGPCP